MKSITIAALISSEPEYTYNAQTDTIKSATFQAQIATGYNEKRVTAEISVTVYGKQAEALQEVNPNVIISGDMELNKNQPMHINNAKVYPGAIGLMLNQVSIAGNVGGEVTYNAEVGVAKVSLATRRTKEVTDWLNCDIWGKQGETANNYLASGSQCAIGGQLKLETWNDKLTGERRIGYRVTADRLTLLGGKRTQETETRQQAVAAGSYDDDF